MEDNPFATQDFQNQVEAINNRATNSDATQQRMALSTPGSQQASNAQQTGYSNANQAISNNPVFQASQQMYQQNSAEDNRRFDATLGAKTASIAGDQANQRYGFDSQLNASKYNADAGVKQTQIGANAQVTSAGLGADASKYASQAGLQGTIAMANASRYNALLGAGTSLTSQQYRPLQFGR